MKFAIVALLFAHMLSPIVGCTGGKELSIITRAAKDRCMKESPVSPKILDEIANKIWKGDESLSRYGFCMFLAMGGMNADGSFNPKVINDLNADIIGYNKYDHIVNKCTENATRDGPDNAGNFALCVYKYMHSDLFFNLAQLYWQVPN